MNFECDSCNKISDIADKESGFPYKEKWIYLFKFNYKLKADDHEEVRDKHFCSKECMFEYMNINIDSNMIAIGERK